MRKVELRGNRIFVHQVIPGMGFVDRVDGSLFIFAEPGAGIVIMEMSQHDARQLANECAEADAAAHDDSVIEDLEDTL